MQPYQLEINALGDVSNKRRRVEAAERILACLQGGAETDPTHPFYRRTKEATSNENVPVMTKSEEQAAVAALLPHLVKKFEDPAERCREFCIRAVMELVPRMAPSSVEWALMGVVARVGLDRGGAGGGGGTGGGTSSLTVGGATGGGGIGVVEPSEELRGLLLELALMVLDVFPLEVGPRGFLDFYTVVLDNCLRDEAPEVKRAACEGCIKFCAVGRTAIKTITPKLAKAVKLHCLPHKHAVTREKAVKAFATLISWGAHELLGDLKDEQDNNSTLHALYTLANDRCEPVRLALVESVLQTSLLEIDSCRDQHRRLMPHLLLLLTDPSVEVQVAANSLMRKVGKQYSIDHEDHSINVEQRRVTLKDIEWYSDEEYPADMSLSPALQQFMYDAEVTQVMRFPGGLRPGAESARQSRPTLGARSAVADIARTMLEGYSSSSSSILANKNTVLSDIVALDWTIPHSAVNKRVAALRVLAMTVFYCETNIVQLTQSILHVLYKAINDDVEEVRQLALVCVELLGKFLKPAQFLPLIIAQPKKEAEEARLLAEEDSRRDHFKGGKIVTTVVSVVEMGDKTSSGPIAVPTLLSTAADTTKSAILIAFRHLVRGSKDSLSAQDAAKITKALASPKVLPDLESPKLIRSLADAIVTVIEILCGRGMVMTPSFPPTARDDEGHEASLQDTLKVDIETKTLDSVLFYVLLSLLGCDDSLTTTVHPMLLAASSRAELDLDDVEARTSATLGAVSSSSATAQAETPTSAKLPSAVVAAEGKPLKKKTLEDEIFGSSDDESGGEEPSSCVPSTAAPSSATPPANSKAAELTQMMTIRSDEVIVKLKSYISDFCIATISKLTTGTETGIYDVHFGRLIYAHLHSMPVAVFTSLIHHTSDIQPFTAPISQIFLAHLSSIDLQLRITDEISFFKSLDRLLWRGKVVFAPSELESLIRSVVLEHGGRFKPGGPAHLLRKIGVSCLCAIVSVAAHREVLSAVFDSDNDKNNRDQYTNEIRVDKPCPLSEAIVGAWLGAVSTDDDVEMRSGCVAVIPSICTLPMDQGQADEVLYAILGRLDDTNDRVRADSVRALGMAYEAILWSKEESEASTATAASSLPFRFSKSVVNTLCHTKLDFVVKTLLPHMDDIREHVGLKEAVCGVFQLLKSLDEPLIMRVVVRDVLEKKMGSVGGFHPSSIPFVHAVRDFQQ